MVYLYTQDYLVPNMIWNQTLPLVPMYNIEHHRWWCSFVGICIRWCSMFPVSSFWKNKQWKPLGCPYFPAGAKKINGGQTPSTYFGKYFQLVPMYWPFSVIHNWKWIKHYCNEVYIVLSIRIFVWRICVCEKYCSFPVWLPPVFIRHPGIFDKKRLMKIFQGVKLLW